MISKSCCKKILKSTGMKVEKVVSIRLQLYLHEVAHKIANELKELAEHNGRKTIQDSDFDFVIKKIYAGVRYG